MTDAEVVALQRSWSGQQWLAQAIRKAIQMIERGQTEAATVHLRSLSKQVEG